MSDQAKLSDFGTAPTDASNSYTCEICGRSFESSKGRGIHRGSAHSEDELKEAMIADLQRVADVLGSPPSQSQMTEHGRYSFSAYQKRFDSWNNALAAAGLRLNREDEISKKKLLDELTRLQDELGRTPTSRDMAEEGGYTSSTYSKKFGSWNTAIQEAGLELGRQTDIQKDDLRDALQDLADRLGHLPTNTEMDQEGGYAVNTYVREFGSWNDALDDVFGEVNRQREVDKAALIDEIRRLGSIRDRIPTADDMRDNGDFALSTVLTEFESWNDGLEAAGYELNEHGEAPEPALLEELKRLNEELGRAPRAIDMENDGRYGWATYRTHFGSWNEALDKIGVNPNKIIKTDKLDHIVRSGWELDVARLLQKNNIKYEYESLEIEYDDGRIYTPDFITDDYVIEVKGRIYRNEKKLAIAALDSLSDREYVVVGTKLPSDIHISWENRENLVQLF